MIEDGHSHVVAYAFVSSEQQHTVTNLLKTFVTNNPKASETSVVIVDKDFTEISAIKEAFQSQPAIQLCQFHVMKALMAAAEQVSSSSEERDHLYKSFKETVHAPTPDAFEEAKKDFFFRFANDNAQRYFEKNWACLPHMWARHLCDRVYCWKQ